MREPAAHWFPLLLLGPIIGLTAALIASGMMPDVDRQPALLIFLTNVAYWTLWALLAPIVFALSARFRFGSGRFMRALAVHAVCSVIVGLLHIVLASVTAAVLRAAVAGVPLPPLASIAPPLNRMLIEWEITIYWAIVGLAHALAYRQAAYERSVTAARLETQLARAAVQVLQRQLQPHFLFNTLQSISALIHRDQRAADRMVDQLSQLLRLTLHGGSTVEVTLDRELMHTRCYLEIEQTNLGSRLTFVEDVPPDLRHAVVPSLLLQPLAENAVKHGIAPRIGGGSVRIVGRRDGDLLHLRVIDDGVGLPTGVSLGVGLQNTRQRLRHLYGDRQEFTVADNPDGGVMVTVRLPYREAAAAVREDMAWLA